MKSKLETSKKKRKHITCLFSKAMTYRVPLPVTKVIIHKDNSAYPICPRCLMSFDPEYMAFCDQCGQKLNWNFFVYARVVRPKGKEKQFGIKDITF